jgi:hypothetical protein
MAPARTNIQYLPPEYSCLVLVVISSHSSSCDIGEKNTPGARRVSCALFRSDLRRVAAIVAGAPWFSAWSELDITGFNAIAYLEAQYPQRPIE